LIEGQGVTEEKEEHMPEICYRALLYPGQKQRWSAEVYNSYHPTPHPQWQGIWNQKEQANPGAQHAAEDFPLNFGAGRYTEQARANYLQFMHDKGSEDWTQAEIDSSSELDGVCCFRGENGPQNAYQYAASSGLPEGVALIATFMGEFVCDVPENGGILAHVIGAMGTPITATEFRMFHDLPQYIAPAPVEGEPQEEQSTSKDIFEDLEYEEDTTPLDLKRDIPWKKGEEFGS
jgi:hypothetical protein